MRKLHTSFEVQDKWNQMCITHTVIHIDFDNTLPDMFFWRYSNSDSNSDSDSDSDCLFLSQHELEMPDTSGSPFKGRNWDEQEDRKKHALRSPHFLEKKRFITRISLILALICPNFLQPVPNRGFEIVSPNFSAHIISFEKFNLSHFFAFVYIKVFDSRTSAECFFRSIG